MTIVHRSLTVLFALVTSSFALEALATSILYDFEGDTTTATDKLTGDGLLSCS